AVNQESLAAPAGRRAGSRGATAGAAACAGPASPARRSARTRSSGLAASRPASGRPPSGGTSRLEGPDRFADSRRGQGLTLPGANDLDWLADQQEVGQGRRL